MDDIFLSYQNKDSARAHLFCGALETKGYSVWVYEKHCHGGKYHREQVDEAIAQCGAFIFIMSETSMESPEVTYELETAHEKEKPIIPVFFDSDWERYLRIKTDWANILKYRTGIDANHNSLEACTSYLLAGLEGEGIYGNEVTNDKPDIRERIVPVKYSGALDHFINRTSELESLKAFVEDKQVRFILLTGPGGYGKSALIQKLIQEITDNFCLDNPVFKYDIDSIIWLDLGKEEARSIDALFNLVNKTSEPGKSNDYQKGWNSESSVSNRIEFLIGRLLSGDRKLIILDNLESILNNTKISEADIDFEKFISTFLDIDHDSVIISTSRRRLTLSPEVEGKHGLRKKEIIMDYGLPAKEAALLLNILDRDGRCKVEDLNQERLDKVVHTLQCVPRILESLIGVLRNEDRDIGEFVNDEEFEDLIANPSKELIFSLSGEAKRIIEVISIFNSPVSREAVQSCFDDINVRNALISLKKCFAVKINEKGQYHLHPIDRGIVYDQINKESRPILHNKAADWYAGRHLDQNRWLILNDIQSHINEIHHRIRAGGYNEACRTLNLIDREYLAVWNNYTLIIQLRREMLDKITDEELLELNYGNLGCALFETGNTTEGRMNYDKALELSRTNKNPNGECRWLGNIAIMQINKDNAEESETMLEEAYMIAKECNDLLHIGRWRGKLATMRLDAQKISMEECISELEAAVETARLESVRDKRFESYWLYDLYRFHRQLGNQDIASTYLDEAIKAKHLIGDYGAEAQFLLTSYNYKSSYSDPTLAIDSVEKAFELKLKIGRQEEAYKLAEVLADFYLSNGMAERANEKYLQILEFSIEVGNGLKEIHYMWQIGLGHFMNGDFKNSLSTFLELKSRAIEIDYLSEEKRYDFNIGDSYIQLFEFDKALEYIKKSLGESDLLDFIAHYEIALIYTKLKKKKLADDHINKCFRAYLNMSERDEVTPQVDFIYCIVLTLKKRNKDAEKKIGKVLEDTTLSTYTRTIALHDISLAKNILPEFEHFDKLAQIVQESIKVQKA